MAEYRNPVPTVDIIILLEDENGNIKNDEIILIKRKNPPYGWALPGGFVDYGETLEQAAVREAKEETSLDVTLLKQFHTYSDPSRDPRQHTITTVYIAKAKGTPHAQDDAKEVGIFNINDLPQPIAFDHVSIIKDFKNNVY
ncbi:MAG: NUDIX hydrolase [Spirochaetota bacterium]|nr:NUDIX hydrolase [Spirochaetota bacterium]